MAARRLLYRSSATQQDTDNDSFGRKISNSFDSSYTSAVDAIQKETSPNSLTKPRSITTLRQPPQRMNSLHSPDAFESTDVRKLSRSNPLSTGSSPLFSSRKGGSPNSRKGTRSSRSSEVLKMPQSGGASAGGGGGGGNSTGGYRNGVSSIQRLSTASTTTKLPILSSYSQSIILFCMDNARSDIALRIMQRMAHKREDFAQFHANLNNEQSAELATSLKKFLSDIVKNIANPEKIREISYQYGAEQAFKRSWGFKADFFAVLADALTTECVFLDGAAHQPTETIEAWATLVELMFTHVRDGYYQQNRQLRRNFHSFSSYSNVSSQSDQSLDGDPLQAQSSPRLIPTTPQNFPTINFDSPSENTTPKITTLTAHSNYQRIQ